jgi:phosphoribosylformylglycinamidine synthase subunit PurSL
MTDIHKITIKGEDVDKIYRVQGVSKKEAIILAEKLFCDPIIQKYSIDQKTVGIEVAYKPGVMNPEVASIIKAAKDLNINLLAADSSFSYKRKNKTEIELNHITQHFVTQEPKTLLIDSPPGPINIVPIRNLDELALQELSKDKLFLNLEEMKIIQNYFTKINRDPTDCELEIIAARWSEHCGHKTFKAKIFADGKEKTPLFSRIKKTAEKHFKNNIISAFVDNSGVMKFYDGWAICGKVETHNSPSAIEPYGGAMTGSGGVFRDPLGTGQGSKLIISNDMFCFAPVDIDKKLLPQGTLHPDYLQRKVVEGVRDYGNRMGIPTNNGSIHYHKDFRAKPTIIVGAYGILPENKAKQGKPKNGDFVVVIGGKTGRDGIHGATFSSGVMTHKTISVNSSAVQIGNAIEEKRMLDAIIEARDKNCIRAITDCGAAGLSSAVGELGEDIGVTVDISKCPLKYSGLSPWEIWLSESQERMVLVISPKNIKNFTNICKKYNVQSTVIGNFDGSHKLNLFYGKKRVSDLDYSFLKKGLPQRVSTLNKKKIQIKTKK